MATRKKTITGPKVVKGTHLTVTTFEDGSTKLEWDDEALLREIRGATTSVKPQVKAKSVRKKKLA
jgi:hypothetical protein